MPAATLSDADWLRLADLALASPVVLEGVVRRVQRIGGRGASDVPQGQSRHLVEVDLSAALKAPGVLPARGEWLWQGPGRAAPVTKGSPVVAFLADPRSGPSAEVMQYRLVSPGAMLPRRPEQDAAIRSLLAEALKPGAAGLMVSGITDAFRTDGTVAGRSESQFFLATTGGQPLTLVVTRLPGEPPILRVATGDVISASAQQVIPRTLLWRALSCGLPDQLPERLSADPGLVNDFALARRTFPRC